MVTGNGSEGIEKASGGELSLTMYERIADPMASAKLFGEAISGSGMFGEVKPKQGMILALECMARRIPPLMLAETYHLIGNKLSMRSEKMLANFNEAGGKHRIISRTGDLASIELTYEGQKNVFSLSWEEAKQEPFVYEEKEGTAATILSGNDEKRKAALKIKKKYATPRARMQMLWARVISDGVNAVMPAARQGCYTPEEVSDYLEGNGSTAGQNVSQGEVVDAEYEVVTPVNDDSAEEQPTLVDDSAGEGAEDAAAVAQSAAGRQAEIDAAKAEEFATGEQSKRLNDLYSALELTAEQIEKALKKRGAANNRGLKFDVAAEFIVTLEKALAAKQLTAAAEVVGESRQNPNNVTNNPGGPATPEQVAEAQKLLVEMNQMQPGAVNRFKAHLESCGLKKMADLSAGEAATLLGDLHSKKLVAFFELSLKGWKPKGGAAAPAELPMPNDGTVTLVEKDGTEVPFQ